MQRYFSASKERIELSSDDIHHITHVMRCRVGDYIEVVFNNLIHKQEIVSFNPFETKTVDIDSAVNEIKNKITLVYALSKGDKNELVAQKATELGATRIVFVSSLFLLLTALA